MSSLAQLRQEHAELVRIVGELETLIAGDQPPASVALYDVRRRLSSTLIAHLKAEDWVLYPPLMSSDDQLIASTAKKFVDEMGGLAQAFTAYVEHWDAFSIESDWAGYQQETRGIIAALSDRILRENQQLYPLLEKLGRAA